MTYFLYQHNQSGKNGLVLPGINRVPCIRFDEMIDAIWR